MESKTNKEFKILRGIVLRNYKDSDVKFLDGEVLNRSLTSNTLANTNEEPTSSSALNLITAGAGVSQRVGREYLLDHLAVRGQIKYLPTATDANQPIARLIIYVDMRNNGTGTSSSGTTSLLLEAPTNADLSVFAFRDLGNSTRFKVLCDKRFVFRPLANIGTTETADATWHFDENFSLTRYALECEGPSGYTIPTNYALRLAVVTNLQAGDLRLDYCYRVRFRG